MLKKICYCCWMFSLLLIAGCGEGPEEEQEAAVEKVAVEALPAYPVSELPEGLTWITNNEEPVFADPKAKQGGEFREYMPGFPLTLRTVGPDSNSGFASYLRANKMSLVDIHPNSEKYIPSLATHWAYGDDDKTVYFKLNPKARWSDGKPVTADDYMFTIEFMRSKYIVAPWYNNYYSKEIAEVKKYDDYTISVTGGTAKPKEDLIMYYGIFPLPRHFHKLDENWVRDYNWEIEPNTGPYQISKVEKGKYIEFKRNWDWWANDLKYYRHRFNVDKVRVVVIRDIETAYRHFLRGELDTAPLTFPNYWHDKTDDVVYKNGYVHKIWFYNDVPQPNYGMYLNMAYDLFKDKNVRYGFAHAMNFDKMIHTILRGDYERLQSYHTGYGKYTNTEIKAREFDLDKADEYFMLAGWQERGPDGIRVKDGKRLTAVVTYSSQAHTDRLVLLREEAKKAGIDLQLNLLDSSAAYKNVIEKKHQIAWWVWSTSLRPSYWEHFHSDNANKPQTNNITNTQDPEMDKLIMQFRDSKDATQRASIARELQQMVHETGAFIPAYSVPYFRQGYWRWLKLPDGYGTKLSGSLFDPMGLSLFWIDEEEKQRTEAAMKRGDKFEPVTIIDKTYKAINAGD